MRAEALQNINNINTNTNTRVYFNNNGAILWQK